MADVLVYKHNRDIREKNSNSVKRLGSGFFGDERDQSLKPDEVNSRRGLHRDYYLPKEFRESDVSFEGIEEESEAQIDSFPIDNPPKFKIKVKIDGTEEEEKEVNLFSLVEEYSGIRSESAEGKEQKEKEIKQIIALYNESERAKGKDAYKLDFDTESGDLTFKGVGEDVKGTFYIRKDDKSNVKREFKRKSRLFIETPSHDLKEAASVEINKSDFKGVFKFGDAHYTVKKGPKGESKYYQLLEYPIYHIHTRDWQELNNQSISNGAKTTLYTHSFTLSGPKIDGHKGLSIFAEELRDLKDRYGRPIFKDVAIEVDEESDSLPDGSQPNKLVVNFDSSEKDFDHAAIQLYDFMQISNQTYSGVESPRLERRYKDAKKRFDGLPYWGPLATAPFAVATATDAIARSLYYVPVLSSISPIFNRISEASYEAAARGAQNTPFFDVGFANYCKRQQVARRSAGEEIFTIPEGGDWDRGLTRNVAAVTTGVVSSVVATSAAVLAIPTNVIGDFLAWGSIEMGNAAKDLGRKSDWFSKYLLSPVTRVASLVTGAVSLPVKAIGSVLQTVQSAVSCAEYLAPVDVEPERRTWGAPFGVYARALEKTVSSIRLDEVSSPQPSKTFMAFDSKKAKTSTSSTTVEFERLVRDCATVLNPPRFKKSRTSMDNKDYIKVAVVPWKGRRIKVMLDGQGEVHYSDESAGAGYAKDSKLSTLKLSDMTGFISKAAEEVGKVKAENEAKSSDETLSYSLEQFRNTFLTPDKKVSTEKETPKQVAIREIKKLLRDPQNNKIVKEVEREETGRKNRWIVGDKWFGGNYVIDITEDGIGIAKQKARVDTTGSLPLVDFTVLEDGSIPINSDLLKAMNWIAAKTGKTHKREGEVADWHYYTTGEMPTSEEPSEERGKGKREDDEIGVGAAAATPPGGDIPPSIPLSAAAPSPSPAPTGGATELVPKGKFRIH